MISSKQVEQSSAAAIASKINSLTSPWIDENRSRTLRATCASAQHNTINAELINKSVKAIFATSREALQRLNFSCFERFFYVQLSAKNNFFTLRILPNKLHGTLKFHFQSNLNLTCIEFRIDFDSRYCNAIVFWIKVKRIFFDTRQTIFICRPFPSSQTH